MGKLKYDIVKNTRLGGRLRVVAETDPDVILVTVNNHDYRPQPGEQMVATPKEFIEMLEDILEATKAVFHLNGDANG